jgi:hypothetical protein
VHRPLSCSQCRQARQKPHQDGERCAGEASTSFASPLLFSSDVQDWNASSVSFSRGIPSPNPSQTPLSSHPVYYYLRRFFPNITLACVSFLTNRLGCRLNASRYVSLPERKLLYTGLGPDGLPEVLLGDWEGLRWMWSGLTGVIWFHHWGWALVRAASRTLRASHGEPLGEMRAS